MSGYRFCRTDDVGLLVDAFNQCWLPHFPDDPEMTEDAFRTAMRELDVWTSSCMVAFSGDELIGVLLAAKRETENLVWRIAVRPDHAGHGHGRHLMTSLERKLAILGPPRVTAEIPESCEQQRRFLEGCGYREECRFRNFLLETPPAVPPGTTDLVETGSFEELLEGGLSLGDSGRCWERAPQTLRNRRKVLQGLAVPSESRIEAWILYHRTDVTEIDALGVAEPGREPLLAALLATLAGDHPGPVHFPKVGSDEIASETLRELGFEPGATVVRYSITAAGE